MPSSLTLLLGDAGTGKTERLLSEYRAALHQGRQRRRPGTVLWLSPTHRAQQGIIEQLVHADDSVQFSPGVLTFDVFADQILEYAGRPATRISPVMKRLLLRRIVADLSQRGKLPNFAPVTQTTGFLDVVSAFISELKREEIWPDEFLEACARRPPSLARRDKELGLIYDKYQHHLARQDWYDNEGRFWLARTALNEGKRDPFRNVEFLVVDGFADFTETQYEILENLFSWIPRAMISLPVEQPMTRPELFDKPESTIANLNRHLPAGTESHIEILSADRSHWPAGHRTIATSLFANPKKVTAQDDGAGLELIAATGPYGECQAIALRIKRLLTRGIPPNDIVVAVRPVSETGLAWKDYMEQAGIPVWCEAGTRLASSPIIKALFSVLQLELEDWPFARLTQLLGSNYFRPTWSEASTGQGVRSVGAALRQLKLHSGRELILRVLSRVAGGASIGELDDDSYAAQKRIVVAELARSAESILKRLTQVTERLRKRHTLSDWGDVIATLGRELGWFSLPDASVNSAGSKIDSLFRESQDWDLFQRILRTAGDTDRRLVLSADTKSVKQPKLDLSEFIVELRDLLGGEQIKATADPGGCVRILDVEQVRHLDVPHLFVVGLAESSFPMNRSEDCLFGETERQEFARRGLPLQHREQLQREEMFLFYSVMTRARSQLTLSYPAVNSKGQPVFASPYLVALRQLFTASALPVAHEGQLDPVPESERALTEADLRLLSISEARAGSAGLFAQLSQRQEWLGTGSNVLAALEVNTQRFHSRGFTGYEGRLGVDPNLSSLRQRFGNRHQFSATELETYANCPFRFWVANVLNVDDLLTPEEGTDHAARGSLIHMVLAQLLREGLDKPAPALAARFQQLVAEFLSERLHETELQRALTRIEQRLLTTWGDAFAQQQTEYARQLSESWSGPIGSLPPEIPFGSLPGPQLPLDSTNPLVFGTEESRVQVRGRIDRVDTGVAAGRRVFNVIDYKTGMAPRSNIVELETGRSIQLALYALAIRRLGLAGPDAEPFQLGYWSVKSTGFKRGYQRDKNKMEPMEPDLAASLEQILDSVVPQLAEGIRSGKFLVENADENCTSYCPYHTACRVNQIRPLAESLYKIGDILTQRDSNSGSDSNEET